MATYGGTPPGWHPPMVLPRPAQRTLPPILNIPRPLPQYGVTQPVVNAARQDVANAIRSGEIGTGYDSRARFLENIEPFTGPSGPQYRGVVNTSPQSQIPVPMPPPDRSGGGGGGPVTPVNPGDLQAVKVRTGIGYRPDLYTESERPYMQGFTPRFIVLGNQQAW